MKFNTIVLILLLPFYGLAMCPGSSVVETAGQKKQTKRVDFRDFVPRRDCDYVVISRRQQTTQSQKIAQPEKK